MNDNLFYTGAFNQTITISPYEISSVANIDDLILSELKKEVENKCIKHGFIKKDSVHILKRTIGLINSSHLDGSINYDINFSAEVCNPCEGQKIKCITKKKKKLGILAENMPIIVVIARNNMRNSNEYETINIGDVLDIEIIGSRFDLYDNNITAIGKII